MIFKSKNQKEIANILGVKVDAVISDMAANTTGNKDLDCIRTNALCAEVIEFSRFIINENGVVIAKLFNGKDFLDVKRLAEKTFRKVNFLNQNPAEIIPRKLIYTARELRLYNFIKLYISLYGTN